MLQLRIGSTLVPLPKEFSLGFELVTNVLNIADRNENSFALPINLPMTEHLAQTLGYSWQPQVQYDLSQTFTDCAVVLDGNDFWLGAMEIGSINDERAKVNFRFASGYIPTVNQKTRLRDFFRSRTLNITANTTNFYTIQWPIDDVKHEVYSLTINGTEYTEQSTELGTADSHLAALAAGINNINVSGITYNATTNIMVVQSVLNADLTVVASYTDASSAVIEPPMSTRSEFAFSSLTGQGTVYELPPMHLPNLYDGRAVNYQGFANTHEVGGFYSLPQFVEDIELTVVPCLKTKWLLEQVFADFGISLTGTWFTDPETSERLEFVPRSIDHEVMNSDFASGLDIDIPVAEFLPDITLSEWLRSIKAESCCSITFNPNIRQASFNLVEPILTSTDFEDWTPYLVDWEPVRQKRYNGLRLGFELDDEDQEIKTFAKERETFTPGTAVADIAALEAVGNPQRDEIRFVQSRNAFYRYEIELDGTTLIQEWRLFAYNLDDVIDTEEELDIRTKYSPMLDTTVAFEGRTMRMPRADVVGFLPALDLSADNYNPRFTIYRGVQKDVQNNDYRMASADVHRADEAQVVGSTTTFSPAVSPTSMEVVRFPAYITMLKNNVEYPVILDLPKKVLQSFDQLKKKRIEGVNFLVMRLSGEIGHSSTSYIRAVLKRVP